MSELDQSNSLDGIQVQEKNIKRVRRPTLDRISVLPCNILDCILGRLPVKDAIKTSILSRSWRYKWVTLPSLDFDDNCVGGQCIMGSFVYKLVNVVYRVLLSHSGQIENFKFSTSHSPEFSHFDRWINFLSTKGTRKLTLKYVADADNKYKLPSCVFSYQLFTHLHISNCLLEPPPTFREFGNLVSLHLIGFTMDAKGLENLIRNCPVLESLALTKITNLARFTIHASKLKYLYLDGAFGNICLENTPLLSEISFKMDKLVYPWMSYDLVRALGCLSGLKRLSLSGHFLKHLGMSNVPKRLHEFKHLRVLELSDASLYAEIEVILSILTSSPSLQELYMSVVDEGFDTRLWVFIASKLQSNCHFNSLRILTLNAEAVMTANNMFHWRCELEFIKFLHARSPILDTFTLKTRGLGLELDTEFLG